MRAMIWVVGAVVILGVAAGAYVRLAPSDPAQWHVDPLTVADPGPAGAFLMRPEGGHATGPVFEMTPAALMAQIDRVAVAEPRVTRLAGSLEENHVTYVVRSALWAFPDYVSVRAMPAEGGARLAVFSRLRFGQSDMGVNRARIEGWIDAVQAAGA